MKKLLILIAALAVLYGGSVLALREKSLSPDSALYYFKLSGEWLDVNFLTFEAPAKQAKHLELAERRFREIFLFPQSTRKAATISRYERELASAYFMAGHLALLDHKYLALLEKVYESSLEHIKSASLSNPRPDLVLAKSQDYNAKAIKTLLQKHQHTPKLSQDYQVLIKRRLDFARGLEKLSAAQTAALKQAALVLDEGRELEWAYDLISAVR